MATTQREGHAWDMYEVRLLMPLVGRLIQWSLCSLVFRRFARAAKNWCNSQLQQATNRKFERMPTVEEFIPMRRYTIGGAMVEGSVHAAQHIIALLTRVYW